MDGEPMLGGRQITIEIQKQALKVIVPPTGRSCSPLVPQIAASAEKKLMKRFTSYLLSNPLLFLLLALPLTLAAQLLGWPPVAVFILAALGIVPLASLIGEATEELAAHTNPRLGALLNATLGNAAELIITITAVQAGLLELVKASITGSIIGNLLLVLGFAMAAGGARYGIQKFNKRNASRNAILLTLAVMTLIIPSVFSQTIAELATATSRP